LEGEIEKKNIQLKSDLKNKQSQPGLTCLSTYLYI
jgi:hypothetical protein